MQKRPFHLWDRVEHETWKRLAARQLANIHDYSSTPWREGFELLPKSMDHVPDLALLDHRLKINTGWELLSTDAIFADGQTWFEALNKQQLLVSEYIRPIEALDYTPKPDIFHDVFGHVPFFGNDQFRRIISKFTQVILHADPNKRKKLGRIWWYTIEFGLLLENGKPKFLGAGLVSSFGEACRFKEGKTVIVPFDPEIMGHTKESPGAFHTKFFVLDSLDQLEAFLDHEIHHTA